MVGSAAGSRSLGPHRGTFLSQDPIGYRSGDPNDYRYVGNNPLIRFDPLGLYTEIIGWNGVGMGSSSFGHISVDINGTSYSYGPNGMDIRSIADYLGINDFRSGTGIILNLTSAQEEAFAKYLTGYFSQYGSTSNNCGSPVQNYLTQIGVLSGGGSLLPGNVMSAIGSTLIGQSVLALGSPQAPLCSSAQYVVTQAVCQSYTFA